MRTWTDSTGKHKVEAELVAIEDGKVRLKNRAGKELTLPIDRLCRADQRFLERNGTDQASESGSTSTDAPATESTNTDEEQLTAAAEAFFADLRSKERKRAAALLTKAGQSVFAAGKSPLLVLPKPDARDNAIRVGKPMIKGDRAAAPVVVTARGDRVRTKLLFQQDGDRWRVAAISAKLPGGEQIIEFGKAADIKEVDPLLELVGKRLPIEGLTIDGEPFSASQYRGKVVLVDFWATWCGPCRAELANIQSNYEAYHDQGFEVVAVSVDKNIETLSEFVAEQQPPWVVLADRHPDVKRSLGGKYGIRSLPSLVLVGRDGKVAAVHCRGKRLGPAVEKALRKRAPASLASR